MSSSQGASIRDFNAADIEAVARLFQSTFRGGAKSVATLPDYLRHCFLEHPWAEPDLGSKVFEEADGRVSGFIGIVPARLELGDRPVRAAVASSLMVENPRENPLAGARLVRAFLAGPQEMSLTETANATAQGLWKKAGYPLEPGYSFNWLKVLRPASAGVAMAARRFSPAGLLAPLGSIADRVLSMGRPAPYKAGETRGLSFRDATLEEFGEALLLLKDVYPLRPRWDRASLGWFMEQAQVKRTFGHPEWRVGYAPDGRPIAAYAYFYTPRGIGWLLQALSVPQKVDDVVDDMFAHAYKMGASALRGAAQPWLTPALMTRRTFFHSRSFYITHARDKTLLEPVRDSQALISGLAGEGWMRLIGDRFD